jgi:hypothetical protein
VAAVALVAFARVVGFGFVYDDGWTLMDNAWLSRPLPELVALLASGEALARHVPDATRPVQVLVQALERRVFGLGPAGYHADSLLLYALVCALATRLALVLTRQRHVALCAGVFFALAPLHAEPVAAINYREDLFAALGVLGALVFLYSPDSASRRAQSGDDSFIRRRHRDSGPRALGAGAFLALGLFAKESALAFVPLAGLIAFCLPSARMTLRDRRRHLYVLGAVLFVFSEAKVASPLVKLALLGDPVLSPSLAMNALVSTVMMATLVVGPFFLSRALGLSEAMTGAALSIGPVVSALCGVVAGRIVDRLGASAMVLAGLALMVAGCAALAVLPLLFGVAGYAAAVVLLTPGYQLFQAANNTAVMADVGQGERGVVSGMLSLSRNLGLITGTAVMGALFAFAAGTSEIANAAPAAIAHGMRFTFGMAAALVLVAILVAVLSPPAKRAA